MTKTAKINLMLAILMILSVMCGKIYWTCNTDYPLDSPKASALLSNPITKSIFFFWITPVPSFLCSVLSVLTIIHLIKKAIHQETEKPAKIAYWEFAVLSAGVLIFHLVTLWNTFLVE